MPFDFSFECVKILNIYHQRSKMSQPIFTKGSMKLCICYEQITPDKKLEVLPKNIIMKNLFIPFHQRWREKDKNSNFIEYRSKDYCRAKVIYHKEKNRFYIATKEASKENQSLKGKSK